MEFRIQDKETIDTPLFPEYSDQDISRGELIAVGLLEDGTTSGQPAIVALVQLENGRLIDFSMTVGMYLTMAAGMKGAMQRWGKPWDGA